MTPVERSEAENGKRGGRPSGYDKPRTTAEVSETLARQGLTDAQIAEELGVSERTLYRWKADHPELCQSIREGGELPNSAVETCLFKRCLGFTYEEGGREKVVIPDITAIRFWLTNRRPDRWREAKAVEVSGSVTRELLDEIGRHLYEAITETLSTEDAEKVFLYAEEKFLHLEEGSEKWRRRRR